MNNQSFTMRLKQLWDGLESKSALLIAIIVSFAPFWRGLFFSSDQLAFSVPVFLIGIVWFWRMKNNPRMDKLDWAVLALSGMYLLSNIVAQNRYQALCWGLQMAAMAVIYFILSRELTDRPALSKNILRFMVIMGSLVALDGLLAYTGLVWGLTDAVLSGRLTATFQYPNTAAAFFNTGMILCLLVAEFSEKRWQKALFSGLYVLQVISFFLCRSRIAFMQFAVILLLFLLLAPWKNKIHIMLVGGVNLIVGMIATNRLQDLYRQAEEAKQIWNQGMGLGIRLNWSQISVQGLAWSLGACLVGALLYYLLLPLLNRMDTRVPSRSIQRRVTYSVLGVTIVIGLLIVSSLFVPAVSRAMQTVLGPFLPADLVNAITNISSSDDNFTSRIMFIQNAIEIGRDYPLLGTGGGGYASVYSRYQPIFTTSRFTHSQPFQVLSETGIPGFVAYIAIWAFGTWLALKVLWKSFNAEEDDSRHLLLAGLIPAVWAIGAHSTFDFDLTYIAMQMWVYALFALIAATVWTGEKHRRTHPEVERAGGRKRGSAGSSPLLAYIIPIFIVILLVTNIPMLVSEKIADSTTGETEFQKIFDTYDRSLKWINFNGKVLESYIKRRNELFVRLSDVDSMREQLQRAMELSMAAVANDPLNPDMQYYLVRCYYYGSDWGNGIPAAKALLEASPYWPSGLDLAARVFNSSFLNLTERGDYTGLRELAGLVAGWDAMINDPLHSANFKASEEFSPSYINLCLAMANVILKDDTTAQRYIELAVNQQDTLAWSALLQAALYQRQGNIAEANRILDHEAMEGARDNDIYKLMLKWR